MVGRILVVGARGMVGGLMLQRLAGQQPIGLSRTPPAGGHWIADVADAPAISTVFATAPASVVAELVPALAAKGARRLVAFTSTSLATKTASPDAQEREAIRLWAEAERRVIARCDEAGIAWTILRPTLIYVEGQDGNVSRIAGLIRRFHFFPMPGGGTGLRQPVHGADLADAAVLAASQTACVNKIYNLPGGETLTYREMVGRIFDALGQPRRIVPVPMPLWSLAMPLILPFFPGATAVMTTRIAKDMVFDSEPAARDIGWTPRPFRPVFG